MNYKILCLSALLSLITGVAYADLSDMAALQVKGTPPPKTTLAKLFTAEAKMPCSKIHDYLAALRADPDNEEYSIADSIKVDDIVRLDNGTNGGRFETNYLIIIRAGYKSNTYAVGYLKANETGSSENESSPVTFRITAPAKVSIE